ncbi:MAG: threonine--tRNA ligase [Calditrichaeota bacterium]|nr:MAG: threonine--tRNA ligase [Calditrichota bacterium]
MQEVAGSNPVPPTKLTFLTINLSNFSHVNINITFPDGTDHSYQTGITSSEIAKQISPGLFKKSVAAKFNDQPVDLNAPLLKDGSLEILTVDTADGLHVLWHSTAHIMAHAVKALYPEAQFGVGPAIENGFYYDIDIDSKLSQDDLQRIEDEMQRIIKRGSSFVRKELTKKEAVDFFAGQQQDKYKLELLADMEDGSPSIYSEGDFTDLCRGPHIPSSNMIKAFKLLSIAGAYWRGDEKNKMLQRIYGISFPKKAQLDEYLFCLEEAKKRDHKKLGKELDLFSFHREGPGFVFWHPKGMRLYRTIETYLVDKLTQYGYGEVKTPIILNDALWKKSGHWDNYKENMYFVDIDEESYAIKPMNCPGSCLIYNSNMHSYRDLPLRLAEFGNVHRHERSGVLNGLFRVRQFTQDDAHIFCTPDQIQDEVKACIDFVQEVYKDFQFYEYHIELSTRPDKSIGSDEIWQQAEDALRDALINKNINYKLNPGDGAFYGPKIDYHVRDSLKRSWQLGTIQLDFSMPEKFELEYVGSDGNKHRPVMIHRAIFGSIERFIAQLIEHHGGRLPVWLSPIQAVVLPLSEEQLAYSHAVFSKLKDAGLHVEMDARNEKIGYKIREAELGKIPYMLIMGKKEVENKQISVRTNKDGDLGSMEIDALIDKMNYEIQQKA